jgi:hypothetical protein
MVIASHCCGICDYKRSETNFSCICDWFITIRILVENVNEKKSCHRKWSAMDWWIIGYMN